MKNHPEKQKKIITIHFETKENAHKRRPQIRPAILPTTTVYIP